MTLSGFQLLSLEEQISILYQQGVYVGKKKSKEFTKLLFQLESFYIEISYTDYRKSIDKIFYSDSTLILDPYLEQIGVEYSLT